MEIRIEKSVTRWLCGYTFERKKEKCRDQRIVGVGTSQFGDYER